MRTIQLIETVYRPSWFRQTGFILLFLLRLAITIWVVIYLSPWRWLELAILLPIVTIAACSFPRRHLAAQYVISPDSVSYLLPTGPTEVVPWRDVGAFRLVGNWFRLINVRSYNPFLLSRPHLVNGRANFRAQIAQHCPHAKELSIFQYLAFIAQNARSAVRGQRRPLVLLIEEDKESKDHTDSA